MGFQGLVLAMSRGLWIGDYQSANRLMLLAFIAPISRSGLCPSILS
jgi:hypothetical protein